MEPFAKEKPISLVQFKNFKHLLVKRSVSCFHCLLKQSYVATMYNVILHLEF